MILAKEPTIPIKPWSISATAAPSPANSKSSSTSRPKQRASCKEAKQLYFAARAKAPAKAIPGGVNAAIQLAKDVEQFGGVEGIRTGAAIGLLESYHRRLREMFCQRGDPKC